MGKGIRRSQSGNQNDVRDASGILFARLRFCPPGLNCFAGMFSSFAGIRDATSHNQPFNAWILMAFRLLPAPRYGGDSYSFSPGLSMVSLKNQTFEQGLKFFQALLAVPSPNRDITGEESRLNCVAGYGALPPVRSWPCRAEGVSAIGLKFALRCGPLAGRICWRRLIIGMLGRFL